MNNRNSSGLEDIKENGQTNNSEEKEENDKTEEEEEIDEIKEEDEEDKDKLKMSDNNYESQDLNNQEKVEESKLEKLFIFLRTGFTWRPIPTIKSTFLCLEITGAIFICIGIIIINFSRKIKQIEIRYDDNEKCQIGTECDIDFTIPEDMEKNVFVYYRLQNFYQNHRRYLKSKSNAQLKGKIMTEKEIKDDCDPIILNKDIYLGVKSIGGNDLNPDSVAHPCGLMAKSVFNDTYSIKKKGGNERIVISKDNIAWTTDKDRYKNSEKANEIQWISVEDERFMVWMRPAALSDFRKPWGIIDRDLTRGEYTVTIVNNYPVKSFDGKKYFILSTVNALGGKNYFLAILYLVMGGISIVSGILFWIGYKKYNDNEKSQKVD